MRVCEAVSFETVDVTKIPGESASDHHPPVTVWAHYAWIVACINGIFDRAVDAEV